MSLPHSGEHVLPSCPQDNKPDFRRLHIGSPVSPLRSPHTRISATSASSSSGSSGSLSARTAAEPQHPQAYSAVSSPPPNVLPAGNICPSGRILKTGMATSRASRSDVLGSGTGNYGHGSIMRGGGSSVAPGKVDSDSVPPSSRVGRGLGVETGRRSSGVALDPEELMKAGNEMYRKGRFLEALELYDKAISISPGNASYRSNRAAAFTGLGRIAEAVRDCEVAVSLDPNYLRAHQRLASLLIRLGMVEIARRHLHVLRQKPDSVELSKLQAVEKHLCRCVDARKVGDWNGALREADAAIAAGADFSPPLFMCRVEALMKLHRLEEAKSSIQNVPELGSYSDSCAVTRIFGMLSETYPIFVRAQMEMALGRFDDAVSSAERAGQIDPENVEVADLLKNVRLIARARARGNDLFRSERFTEACSAYEEGLKIDPSNSILYCNRAACWFKLGQWERSVEDCRHALDIQPSYTKALLRKAVSNCKLERWADAVRDYEVLRKELPDDSEVAESLFHAQVSLKKSLGEEVVNMQFGGDVEEVATLEQFKAAISLPGVSVVHFKSSSNQQCKHMSSFMDILCSRYPAVNFLQVDTEECRTVANAENVRIIPTFKMYKNGNRVKEIICPSRDVLEHLVRHYSI